MLIKTDPEYIAPYLTDASNSPGGIAEQVIIPENTEELQNFLKKNYAADKKFITVAGRRTGLCGGCIPPGGIVISTERLNDIGEPQTNGGITTVKVGPGAILGDIQRKVESMGYLYPPDPTERGCSIGGAIVHNSSGARTFKYGPTRNYIEALTILLANGDRLHLRRGKERFDGRSITLRTAEARSIPVQIPSLLLPPIKHAAGYYAVPNMEAIDLFIGSEGTLGIVVEAELRLLPYAEHIFAGIVFFEDESRLLDFVEEARDCSFAARQTYSSDTLDARALEYFDLHSLNMVRHAHTGIPHNAIGAIWFEQEVSPLTEDSLIQQWYSLIEKSTPFVEESWFALTEKDQEKLRAFRHSVPASIYEKVGEKRQTKIGTDMAVPDAHFREFLQFYREEFAREGISHVIFGHIGNSHVHANMFAENEAEREKSIAVYRRCISKALSLGGTVSAEHGIGKIKRQYLEEMYGDAVINSFRSLKAALDPLRLLNSGTMFVPS